MAIGGGVRGKKIKLHNGSISTFSTLKKIIKDCFPLMHDTMKILTHSLTNSFFDRSFVYAAPTLWNALDLDIRLLPFDAFKKRVKTHLYLKYFVN